MSIESLRDLMKQCESNAALREQVRMAPDFDSFIEIASEAGFEVSASDWVEDQANMVLSLSDEDLEKSVGGTAEIIRGIADTVVGGTEAIIRSGPDKSGNWGSFAHWSC